MFKPKSVAGTDADPTIQFSTLKLDGQEFRLAYSFNAIAKAEQETGLNLLQGLRHLDNLSAQELRGLFYAALSVADPAVTIEEAGALIPVDRTAVVTDAIVEAYLLSMPKKDPPPAAAVEPPAAAQD